MRDARYGSGSSFINSKQEVRCVQTRTTRSSSFLKLFDGIPESEDCLYLNVYAPQVSLKSLKVRAKEFEQ